MNSEVQSYPLAEIFRFRKKAVTLVFILAAVFLFGFYGAASSLVATWNGRDDYSHGFLVPLISLYFVWADRRRLGSLTPAPNLAGGLFLTLAGALMNAAGGIGGVMLVQQISILVIIPGLVLLLLGTRFLKALALPLLYLVLMVPLLDPVIKRIQWPFQLLSAAAASDVLTLLGVPVFNRAQYLELPTVTLEVADVCSGVRYLVSIIALTIPLAYFTQRGWKKKGLLFVLAVLIGIFTNILRVILIGLWSYFGGTVVHGPMHLFQGLFVSVVGMVFLFIIAMALSRAPSADAHIEDQALKNEEAGPVLNASRFNIAYFIAIAMLLGQLVYLHTYTSRPVPVKRNLNAMPMDIGGWTGMDISRTEAPFSPPSVDSELARIYRNASGRAITLYVGYYATQMQDKEMIHDSMRKLYEDAGNIKLPTASMGQVSVNETTVKAAGGGTMALYWYDINGRILSSNYTAKLYTAAGGLFKRRTNGAVVITSTIPANPADSEAALNDELDFAGKLLPLLRDYLP
ncbi:MAG: exosortase W [Deltaproteobacteria bacterium]|nr:exosortase W [Deltaproteobacteria bacterium]